MADSRAISQLEAQGYPWIGCECCKGTVWVPFRMLRDRIPMLSAMTLDQLGARMRCDKCDKRARAILSCKSERHGRVCSKDLDSPLEEERDVCTWHEARHSSKPDDALRIGAQGKTRKIRPRRRDRCNP